MAYTLRSVSCLWLYLITSTQTKQVQVKTGRKFGYFQFGPWQFESIYRVNDFITKFIESNYQIIKSETHEDSILARTFKKLAAGSNIAATDAGRCFCFVLFCFLNVYMYYLVLTLPWRKTPTRGNQSSKTRN